MALKVGIENFHKFLCSLDFYQDFNENLKD